ncbi:MAG: hypothetical protein GY898_04355 [Proteobacteria bacterium]|nr:hypothetical protein [Pseudomonadota bacterium]
MSQHTWDVPSLGTLQRQWRRSMKFGVLMVPLYPAPDEGSPVTIRVRCNWEGVAFELNGKATQVNEGASVIELDAISASARDGLVKAGIPDAASLPDAPDDAPTGDHDSGLSAAAVPPAPEPTPAPAEPTPEPPVEAAPEAPAAPEPTPPPAAPVPAPTPTPAPSRPASGGFRPKSIAFKPKAARPSSAPARPVPTAPPSRPSQSGPVPTGSRDDIASIASAAGPATLSGEMLMEPAVMHGDFSKVSFGDVLLHFVENTATGVLAMEAFREVRWCYLIDGKPVHYLGDKPHPGEFLSDALVADGVIDVATWAGALRVQKLTGVSAGQYLVTSGKLKAGELREGLQKRAERITRNLLGMNFGKFRFHELEVIRTVFDFKPVPVLSVLLSQQRASFSAIEDDKLVQSIEEYYPLHVRPIPARLALLGQLPLQPRERELVDRVLPAGWTLGELVSLKELDERTLVRLLLSLKALGMIEFVRDEGPEGKRNRAERKLYIGLRDLIRRSPFEAVHSHWSSSAPEIKAGYQKVLEEFSKKRFSKVLDPRIEGIIEQIHARAHEVWALLATRGLRREQRLLVVGVDQLQMASDLLDTQGEMATFKNDFRYVRACYERVQELDPGRPEGTENRKRAKLWLADPRVAGANIGDLADLDDKLNGLL